MQDDEKTQQSARTLYVMLAEYISSQDFSVIDYVRCEFSTSLLLLLLLLPLSPGYVQENAGFPADGRREYLDRLPELKGYVDVSTNTCQPPPRTLSAGDGYTVRHNDDYSKTSVWCKKNVHPLPPPTPAPSDDEEDDYDDDDDDPDWQVERKVFVFTTAADQKAAHAMAEHFRTSTARMSIE
jgi:hypothetical protein